MDAILEVENRSVLIIDDEAGIRESLAELLESEGFEIFTAINGRVALEKLHQRKITPNAILLDLFMPEMNGFEFLVAVRSGKEPTFEKVPVLLMTAGSSELAIVQNASHLADKCLKKPLDVDALLLELRDLTDGGGGDLGSGASRSGGTEAKAATEEVLSKN